MTKPPRATEVLFADEVLLEWFISTTAQSQPNFTQVGTAANTAGGGWNMYKDDQRIMFTDSEGFNCRTIYWCF